MQCQRSHPRSACEHERRRALTSASRRYAAALQCPVKPYDSARPLASAALCDGRRIPPPPCTGEILMRRLAWTVNLGMMASRRQLAGAQAVSYLPPVHLERLSSAFELPLRAVQEDAVLARSWRGNSAELAELLRGRHDWDASMAPYYVRWLLGCPAAG